MPKLDPKKIGATDIPLSAVIAIMQEESVPETDVESVVFELVEQYADLPEMEQEEGMEAIGDVVVELLK
jgi:hypothetical protein